MQWLIDIILSLIHTTDIYVNRGDPGVDDFVIGDFTRDGAWHALDLSAIVPANATAVSVRTVTKGTTINRQFRMRTPRHANAVNIYVVIQQIANLGITKMGTIYPDEFRFIEYWFTDNSFTTMFMTINGWWLKKN